MSISAAPSLFMILVSELATAQTTVTSAAQFPNLDFGTVVIELLTVEARSRSLNLSFWQKKKKFRFLPW